MTTTTAESQPFQAEVVRRIYERFEAGVSQQGIARELNREGTPPMKAKRWSQPVVSKILHDEFYAGRVDGAKGLHEPIITDAGRTSGGVTRLQTGTLYMALDRLCSAGLVEPDVNAQGSQVLGRPDP